MPDMTVRPVLSAIVNVTSFAALICAMALPGASLLKVVVAPPWAVGSAIFVSASVRSTVKVPPRGLVTVSYTHLTLPTILLV